MDRYLRFEGLRGWVGGVCVVVVGLVGLVVLVASASAQPAAGRVREFVLPQSGEGPLGITIGSDNAVWFTENANGGIGRFAGLRARGLGARDALHLLPELTTRQIFICRGRNVDRRDGIGLARAGAGECGKSHHKIRGARTHGSPR